MKATLTLHGELLAEAKAFAVGPMLRPLPRWAMPVCLGAAGCCRV